MNLKTFRGDSMAAALAEVKKGLGQDAVILHTRTYRVGAVFGIGGRNVVEITASDQAAAREAKKQVRRPTNPYGTAMAPPKAPAAPAPPVERSATPAAAGSTRLERRAEAASEKDSFTPSTFGTVRRAEEPVIARTMRVDEPVAGTERGRTPQPPSIPPAERAPRSIEPSVTRAESQGRPAIEPTGKGPQDAPRCSPPAVVLESIGSGVGCMPVSRLTGSPATLSPVDGLALATLQDELSSIKKLVGQVLQCSRKTAAGISPSETESRGGSRIPGTAAASGVMNLGGMSEPLFTLYMSLTESGVTPELAEGLVGKVRDELSPGELIDEIVVGQCMLRHLAEMLRVVGSLPKLGVQADGRPLVMALIGPTGVGKTTTIAKLAATFKLRHGKKVGLITADTYRIAAVEQLRTYAEIIGLPLKVVNSPSEVASAADSLHDCDVILLDTAGRSQHDKGRLHELQEIVGAARPHEIHLVLSSTVAEGVMRRTAERFAALAPTRVIFTKLDEAVTFGCIANMMEVTRLPIGFVTTGQEVPDQIELADAPRLARLVLQTSGRLVGAGAESGA